MERRNNCFNYTRMDLWGGHINEVRRLYISLLGYSLKLLRSSLFILSWYDNSDDAPTPLPLIFSYDCLDIFWRILCIPKSAYRSDEHIYIIPSFLHHPPITGYRILVSTVVTIFGVGKMMCSYMGLNTTPNAIEWVFAAIVSTRSVHVAFCVFFDVQLLIMLVSLYLLGLYEDNTCDLLPFLFTEDYSDEIEGVFYVGK